VYHYTPCPFDSLGVNSAKISAPCPSVLAARNLTHTSKLNKGTRRNEVLRRCGSCRSGQLPLWGLMERRQHYRYDLEGPLSFSWSGPGGVRHRHQGLLRNISGGGVFISTGDCPPEGARIQFSMAFDSFAAGSRLVIRARAQVVRVKLAAGDARRAGFAAAIKKFALRNEKKLIERGTVGEGLESGKSTKKKALMKSEPSNLLWR
jgi:hypothetical protein